MFYHQSDPPVIRRALLLLLAALLSWQMVTRHMAAHYTERAKDGDNEAIERALQWRADDPGARRMQARALIGNQPSSSPELQTGLESLRSVLRDTQLDARALGLLISTEGLARLGLPNIDTIPLLADRLAPVSPQVQRDLAIWSLSQRDSAGAVRHAAQALVGNPAWMPTLFELMHSLSADPDALDVLEAIAADPREYTWWLDFLRYLEPTPEDDTLFDQLITIRQQSIDAPILDQERAVYLRRLIGQNNYKRAYVFWVNGLQRDELSALGYLFDGGFDHPIGRDGGFGWRTLASPEGRVSIGVLGSFGSSNTSALKIDFDESAQAFHHLRQTLALPPGHFVLSGRVRPDHLDIRRGLAWRIRCLAPQAQTLGTSESFKDFSDWRRFDVEFEVPSDCAGQELRLESAGDRPIDHDIDGVIWFDDLSIEFRR